MAQSQQEIDQHRRRHDEFLLLLLALGKTQEQLRREGIQYVWDTKLLRYWSVADEAIVSTRQVRNWVDLAIANTERNIDKLTRRLLAGEIDYPTWYTMVQPELKAMHSGLAQVAIGGRQQWNPVAAGRLGARMRMINEKLNALGLDWTEGRISEAQMLNRIGMAVHAGRGTYEGMFRGLMIDSGLEMERNLLAAGVDHCAECPDVTAQGWVPIGTLPGIGERICLTRDMCEMEYAMMADVEPPGSGPISSAE